MRAVIFANGHLENHNLVLSQISSNDLLIAADGGSDHYKAIDKYPDIVIGDMDSISPGLAKEFQRAGTEFKIYPQDKDQTDLELALTYARQEVVFFGILGGRLDLSLGNILLLARDDWKSLSIVINNWPDKAYILRAGESITVQGQPKDIVSLIPLSEQVEGVSTEGLRWKIYKETLVQGNTRSISNEIVSEEARIKIDNGKMLVVHRELSAGER